MFAYTSRTFFTIYLNSQETTFEIQAWLYRGTFLKYVNRIIFYNLLFLLSLSEEEFPENVIAWSEVYVHFKNWADDTDVISKIATSLQVRPLQKLKPDFP